VGGLVAAAAEDLTVGIKSDIVDPVAESGTGLPVTDILGTGVGVTEAVTPVVDDGSLDRVVNWRE
jgi:hypothetical protein